jgi:Tetratricopeptide repeat
MLKNLLELITRIDFWSVVIPLLTSIICLLIVSVKQIRRYFDLLPEFRLWLLFGSLLAVFNQHSDISIQRVVYLTGWVLLAFWLYWASWYFVVFRWLWYWPAWPIGRFRIWFRNKGFLLKVATVWVTLSLFIGWITYQIRQYLELDNPVEPSFIQFILKDMFGADFAFSSKCALSIILFYSIYLLSKLWVNQSNQIVIQAVKTYGVPKESDNSWVEGLPARLNHELQRINTLFDTSDYAERKINYTGTSGSDQFKSQMPQFNLGVSDVKLDTILAKESEVKVGWLSFSPKAILNELNRLVPRSNLTLSIYFFEHQVILDVALSGKSGPRQWRIERLKPSKMSVEQLSVLVYDMIEELSYQIFAEVQGKERLGSSNWRAIRYYLEGVTAFRRAVNSSSNATAMLNAAEVAFGKALVEDNDFGRCFYNLGIVYLQLDNYLASTGVFTESLALEPNNQDAWYGLAMAYRNRGDSEKAIQACEQMIRLNPNNAIAWNLIGMLTHQKAQNSRKAELHFAVATMLSWKSLCLNLFKGRDISAEKKDAALYLRNLGVEQVNYSSYASHFLQLIWLTGTANLLSSTWILASDSDNRYQLMLVLIDKRRLYWAKRQSKKLVLIQGNNHLYHLWYATLSGIFNQNIEEEKHLKLAFANGLSVIEKSDDNYHYRYFCSIYNHKRPQGKAYALLHLDKDHAALNDEFKTMLEDWEHYTALLDRYEPNRLNDWDKATPEELKGHMQLLNELIETANTHFQDLIYQVGFKGELASVNLKFFNRFPAKNTDEVQQQQAELLNTIQYAQESFSNQPVYFWERYVLHLIYLHYNDWDHAYDELQVSLGLADVNNRNSVALWLTEVASNKAFFSNDMVTRKENIVKTIVLLRDVIGQYDGRWKHATPNQLDWQLHAALHCWLGQLLIEQLDYHQGILYLEQGLKLYLNVTDNYSKIIEINAWLCYALVKTYAFEAADDAFKRLEQRKSMAKPSFVDTINWCNGLLQLVNGYAMRGLPLSKGTDKIKQIENVIKKMKSTQPEEQKLLLETMTNIAIAFAHMYYSSAQNADSDQEKLQLLKIAFDRLSENVENEVYPSLQAELYFYLGEISHALSVQETQPNLKQKYQYRAISAWKLAHKLDLRGEYQEELGGRLKQPAA